MARIDYENPIVQPGYPVPFSTNVYEVGQYAPSEHTLTALRLLEAKDLGLFLDRTLDIYDKEGNISEEKIKRLNKNEILSFAVRIVDEDTPLYALLNIRAVYKQFHENFFKLARFDKLFWHKKSEISLFKIDPDLFIIGHKIERHSVDLHVFQPYYIYITVPVVKRTEYSQGISVASLATARNYASLVFKKLAKNFPDIIEQFIHIRGWKRKKSETEELAEDLVKSGEVFGLSFNNNWYHKEDNERYSLGSVNNPKEDFIDGLVFYYFHRTYLQQFPSAYKFFSFLEEFVRTL